MKLLLNIIFFGLFVVHVSAQANCIDALEDLTVTEKFIAYVENLFEQSYIENPTAYIQTLLTEIESKRPLSSPFTQVNNSDDIIQHQSFRTYINHTDLDREVLKKWLVSKISVVKKMSEQKNDSKKQTANGNVQMNFHKISPGWHDRYFEEKYPRPKEINTPFEMMETTVTNSMWFDLMGRYPFESAMTAKRPDYPVVRITWWSAAIFANRLSEKHGYQPVYDFSQIKLWTGTAERGDYQPVDVDSAIKFVRINREDIYKAEGFRLPTLEELLMIYFRFDNRTNKNEKLHGHNMFDYGWFERNSNRQHQPVAEKLPFIIDGNNFYDLYGNVQQWTHSFNQRKEERPLLNPQTDFRQATAVNSIFGENCFAHDYYEYRMITDCSSSSGHNTLGFRLARSLPKEKKP